MSQSRARSGFPFPRSGLLLAHRRSDGSDSGACRSSFKRDGARNKKSALYEDTEFHEVKKNNELRGSPALREPFPNWFSPSHISKSPLILYHSVTTALNDSLY
ncbi:unnamed protein product [Pieris brassicae]|uniref:Uncharacterized protein n=1 Tax=Pieris brassicae TaxID=7116 RepID=A0A9P0TYS7_PIEBR|nr:unnamed protein product [Pieris brassicae]